MPRKFPLVLVPLLVASLGCGGGGSPSEPPPPPPPGPAPASAGIVNGEISPPPGIVPLGTEIRARVSWSAPLGAQQVGLRFEYENGEVFGGNRVPAELGVERFRVLPLRRAGEGNLVVAFTKFDAQGELEVVPPLIPLAHYRVVR